MSGQMEIDFGVEFEKPKKQRKPLKVSASLKLQKSIASANHYFDEDRAVDLLNGLKTGAATVSQLAPMINPIITGVVNRRAYCEDAETREDLVGDVWVGILRYGLLDRWEPGYSRAFSYLTGIAQNTLMFILGDRNKRRKAIGYPGGFTDLDECEQIAAFDQPKSSTGIDRHEGRFEDFTAAIGDLLPE